MGERAQGKKGSSALQIFCLSARAVSVPSSWAYPLPLPNTGKSLHFLGNVASMFLMNLIVAKSDFGEDSGSDFFFSF